MGDGTQGPRPPGGLDETAATVTASGPPPGMIAEEVLFERGTQLGRYLVLDMLGSGGMGVVYRAYDPELDRRVALKVLRSSDWGTGGKVRLLREAQAMAKLSHPNVVAVHDVGTFGDQVFLAMDLVDGPTLGAWLADRERPWREIVGAFAQAGAGLAAAHEAGLVHRDFKPANALVNARGRVQVTDFGVVHAIRAGTDTEEDDDVAILGVSSDRSSRPLDTPVTRAGAAVGTLKYMAPEQHRGVTSTRADQFAFCVSLWDALYGEHPFATGEGAAQLEIDHRRTPAAPRSRVPARVERALVRGLARDPEARHPTMDALLADITREPRRVWGIAAIVAVAIAAGGATMMLGARGDDEPRMCKGAADELSGAWDASVRSAGAAAFAASSVGYAEDAWERVARGLDDYTRAWRTMYREACEATRVRGTQSAALLDARMACLDQRREEIAALTALFADPGPTVVERAAEGVDRLSPLATCADVAALSARVPLPDDPQARAELDEIEAVLARSKALHVAGDHASAVELSRTAVSRAEAVGYAPTRARALVWLGTLLRGPSPDEAEKILHRALQAAVAGRDDRSKVAAWNELIYVTGYRLARPDEGARWAAYAEAGLTLLDEGDDLEIQLLRLRGMLIAIAGDPRGSLDLFAQALDLATRVHGPDSYEAALIHTYRAVSYANLGEYEDALADHRREIAIYTDVRGPGHPALAMPHNNTGLTLVEMGRYAEAREHLHKAIAIWRRVYGDDDGRLSLAYFGLGMASAGEGDHRAAVAHYERSIAVRVASEGPDHPELAGPLLKLGESLQALGRTREAIPRFERAVAIWEGVHGPEHSALPGYLAALAGAEQEVGEVDDAIAHLERALAIARKGDEPEPRARAAFGLARTLASAERASDRARDLARAAHDDAEAMGERGAELVAEIDAWLARAP